MNEDELGSRPSVCFYLKWEAIINGSLEQKIQAIIAGRNDKYLCFVEKQCNFVMKTYSLQDLQSFYKEQTVFKNKS